MDNFENIFDKFNDKSLKDESWLEPSEGIFAAIEKEIEEKPSKRRVLWWFWFGAFIILIGVILLAFNLKDRNASDIIQLEQVELNAQENSYVEKASQRPETILDKVETIASGENVKSSKKLITQTPEILEDNNKKISSQISNNSESQNLLSSNEDNIDKEPKVMSTTFMSANINIDSENSTILNSLAVAEKKENRILFDMLSLNRINSDLSRTPRKELLLETNKAEFDFSEVKNEKRTHWAFIAGINTISWNDELNDNYKSALALADFSNTSALGNQFYIGVQKRLTKKMSLDLSMSYTKVETNSGHNAVINYNCSSETDLTNQFESVTLATPYGFMDSDFVIQRADGSVSEDINLLSAIHSQHQLDFIGLHTALNYELLRYKRLGVELNYGLSYYYLNQISNQLDYLNTNHSDYNYADGRIISSQKGLSTGFFEMNLGGNLIYDLCDKLSFGLSYDFNQGLTPIFKETDFSSTTKNHSFGAFVKRNF